MNVFPHIEGGCATYRFSTSQLQIHFPLPCLVTLELDPVVTVPLPAGWMLDFVKRGWCGSAPFKAQQAFPFLFLAPAGQSGGDLVVFTSASCILQQVFPWPKIHSYAPALVCSLWQVSPPPGRLISQTISGPYPPARLFATSRLLLTLAGGKFFVYSSYCSPDVLLLNSLKFSFTPFSN